MKKIILVGMIILILSAFMLLNAQWAKTYGGGQWDRAFSIRETYDGGIIIAGYTRSFGAGYDDFWILKLKTNGKIEWQHTYGGSNQDWAFSIQQTLDEGYIVAGSTYSYGEGERDFWILKLDSTGIIEWQNTYGKEGSERALCVQQTIDGGYIVAGDTNSFGSKSVDFLVLKLDSAGDIEWQRRYGESENEYAYSIQQTDDGGYVVAGFTYSISSGAQKVWVLKLNFLGDIEWQHKYGSGRADSIQKTNDGGYIVAGYSYLYSAGWIDFLVLKLDSKGDIEWQHVYGGNDKDWARSIQQTIDGGYIVAGETDSFGAGSTDFLVLKLDSAGNIEWQRVFGGSDEDSARSIQQTFDGRYIVTGYTDSFGIGDHDFLILKLNSNGKTDPSCGFEEKSDVKISDPHMKAEDTIRKLKDTNIKPKKTNISPRDTDVIAYDFCEGKYILRIKVEYGGTTEPSPGTYFYDPGTEVTVKAIPDSECNFLGWSGDASGIDNPITITMDSNKSIKAEFRLPYTPDPIEWGNGGGGGWDIGPCFIATAAYSSQLHPHVKILRDFRDKYLMPYKFGRFFVDFYYKHSPFVANLVAKHKLLKIPARINLLPLVAFSYSMLHFGPIITAVMFIFIFTSPFFFVLFYRRKLRSCWIRIRQRK